MQDFIKINKDDNVAVALKPIAKGTTLNVAGTEVTTIEDIPQGHKFAIKPVKKGDEVVKYGFRIGYAQADVEVGGWIHTHNLKTALGELLEYTYNPEGVCSMQMIFDIEGDIIKGLKIIGGCPGNTVGVSRLVEGRKIDDVIQMLKGIECGVKGTSCPDQVAKALEKYKIENL